MILRTSPRSGHKSKIRSALLLAQAGGIVTWMRGQRADEPRWPKERRRPPYPACMRGEHDTKRALCTRQGGSMLNAMTASMVEGESRDIHPPSGTDSTLSERAEQSINAGTLVATQLGNQPRRIGLQERQKRFFLRCRPVHPVHPTPRTSPPNSQPWRVCPPADRRPDTDRPETVLSLPSILCNPQSSLLRYDVVLLRFSQFYVRQQPKTFVSIPSRATAAAAAMRTARLPPPGPPPPPQQLRQLRQLRHYSRATATREPRLQRSGIPSHLRRHAGERGRRL